MLIIVHKLSISLAPQLFRVSALESPTDWPSSAEWPLPPYQLAHFLITDEEEPEVDKSYDISQVVLREHIFSLLIEFLEKYQNWKWREVKFISSRNNIPLLDEACVTVHLHDGTVAELTGIPLYQHQVKGNSEDVWQVFKAVMKGENTPLSWRRALADFEGLSEKATYHVRRLESPEVKRQVVTDFIAQYGPAGVKQVSIKPDQRGYFPWFMLHGRNTDRSVKLCVVIDNESKEQNNAQFFELVKLYSTKSK
jgi:hypothetical protein